MTDYNNMLKTELIEVLQQKEIDCSELEAQVQELKEQTETLQNQLDECQNQPPEPIQTAEDLINAILNLPEEEVQILPVLIRTTDDGIEAHTAFVYGVLSCINDPITPTP